MSVRLRERESYPPHPADRVKRPLQGWQVVGRCWACGDPVRKDEARWTPDPGVVNRRTSRPVRRLSHGGSCEDRVRAKVTAHGVQDQLPIGEAPAGGASVPSGGALGERQALTSRLPTGGRTEQVGALTFHYDDRRQR